MSGTITRGAALELETRALEANARAISGRDAFASPAPATGGGQADDWGREPRVRRPLLRARVGEAAGGAEIQTIISAEVTSNNAYQADRLRATFRLSPRDGFGLRWWGDQRKLILSVDMGLAEPGGAPRWQTVFIGEVDSVETDPAQGTVECQARDLSARFVDAKTQETFLNQTSSEVVQVLAGRRGLRADVTPTTTLVSRYYKDDHESVSGGEFRRATTEWDLLASLARNEGFDLWVLGTTIYFHPAAKGGKLYRAEWGDGGAGPVCNVMNLRLERDLTLAKNHVVVAVRSWHGKKGRGFTKTSPSNTNLQKGDGQRFTVVRPDLTEDQAQKLADSIREDIIKNERLIRFDRPGDLSLTCRDKVQLAGTQSSWDQTYWVYEINRSLSVDGGFLMHVSGKNHSPESEGAR